MIAIGERRKPRPQGRPGFLRIDTVHQGDQDGVKGIYHINAVDEVTQWEIVAATPQISEHWLIPLLEQLLEQFPFTIRGFHSDNGSEFINYTVSRLLEKLLIEQTKSRAHRTGDNGLVEAKNGAIVRKHMGVQPYCGAARRGGRPVPPRASESLYELPQALRGCQKSSNSPTASGRESTGSGQPPFEIFSQTPQRESFLRPGVSIGELDEFAHKQSDTEAAIAMQQAKKRLLSGIARRSA